MPSQDTEKIPLGRQIMVDSISPEDDEDDEISKIVRGSVSDGELEDEELSVGNSCIGRF